MSPLLVVLVVLVSYGVAEMNLRRQGLKTDFGAFHHSSMIDESQTNETVSERAKKVVKDSDEVVKDSDEVVEDISDGDSDNSNAEEITDDYHLKQPPDGNDGELADDITDDDDDHHSDDQPGGNNGEPIDDDPDDDDDDHSDDQPGGNDGEPIDDDPDDDDDDHSDDQIGGNDGEPIDDDPDDDDDDHSDDQPGGNDGEPIDDDPDDDDDDDDHSDDQPGGNDGEPIDDDVPTNFNCKVPCLAGTCVEETCECFHGFGGPECTRNSISSGRIGFPLLLENLYSFSSHDSSIIILSDDTDRLLADIGLKLSVKAFREDILMGVFPAAASPSCINRLSHRPSIGTGLSQETLGVGVYDLELSIIDTGRLSITGSKVEVTAITDRGHCRVSLTSGQGDEALTEPYDIWASVENNCDHTREVSVAEVTALPAPGFSSVSKISFTTRERASFVLSNIFVEYYVEPRSDSDNVDDGHHDDKEKDGSNEDTGSKRPRRPEDDGPVVSSFSLPIVNVGLLVLLVFVFVLGGDIL
ncbi:hypothetical protein GEMRC1_003745 [Eukaryota sp. GEM-RC1]